jgi:hypothetical protein
MGRGREAAHVGADLRDDALGGPLADPGDGVQAIPGLSERGDHPVDLGVQRRDGTLKVLKVVQRQAHQQPVMVAEAAVQRLPQQRKLLAQRAPGQLGQHLGVTLTGHQGSQHRPSRHAQHVGGHRVELDAGVFQGLCTRWHSAVWAWISRLR